MLQVLMIESVFWICEDSVRIGYPQQIFINRVFFEVIKTYFYALLDIHEFPPSLSLLRWLRLCVILSIFFL